MFDPFLLFSLPQGLTAAFGKSVVVILVMAAAMGRVEGQCEVAAPFPQTDCYGDTVHFTVPFNDDWTFQWESSIDGTNFYDVSGDLAGANTNSLTIYNIGVNGFNSDGTVYRVRVTDNTGICPGQFYSGTALLSINSILSITPNRQNQEICQGEDYSFSVLTQGVVISWEWKFNDGTGLRSILESEPAYTGENSYQLTISNATPAQTGYYRVTVLFQTVNQGAPFDTCVKTSTLTRYLTVNPSPTISGPASVCLNSIHVYSTETGMSDYAWTITNGTIISGGSQYDAFIEVQLNGAGGQTISVSYRDGVCVSMMQTNITVNPLPVTSPIYHR
jgi:hypothetical protein